MTSTPTMFSIVALVLSSSWIQDAVPAPVSTHPAGTKSFDTR